MATKLNPNSIVIGSRTLAERNALTASVGELVYNTTDQTLDLFRSDSTWATVTPNRITWNTAAGSLGSAFEGQAVNITLSATLLIGTVNYAVVSGSLPAGLSLNASSGVISGTLSQQTTQTYNFTIRASNAGTAPQADRAFSYTVTTTTVAWTTASGSLGSDYTERVSTFNAVATTTTGSLTFSVVSGSINGSQTLSTVSNTTARITGTAAGISDFNSATYNFTLRATNAAGRTADRAFSYLITSRKIGYRCSTANEGGGVGDTAPGAFIFIRRDFSSYGTPNGSCGAFGFGGCNNGASNNWNPTPTKSYSYGCNNGTWGDPCGGVGKRCYVQMTYGPF